MSNYTNDGSEWTVHPSIDAIVVDPEHCGYDGCGEEGPVIMTAQCLIVMLETLGYDLSEVELK